MAGVWTNNWRAFRNIMLMGCHYNGFSTITKTDGSVLSNQFADEVATASPMGKYVTDIGQSGSLCGLRVGTGETPAAATDYQLVSTAGVSYLSVVTANPTFDTATGIMTREISLSVQNQTASSITITEWGIYGAIKTLASYSSNLATALLYREVLDSPVTLAPLQAATLTLTMTLTLTDIL